MGYFTGYLLFEVVQLFFPVTLLTKTGKLASIAKYIDGLKGSKLATEISKISKKYKKIADKLEKRLSTSNIQAFLDLLKFMSEKMRLGTKGFVNWLEEIFEGLKKWLDELMGKYTKVKSRKPTKKDENELKKIRKKFSAGKRKNVATTKGVIGGKKINLMSRSGEPKKTPQNFDNFKQIDPKNYRYTGGPLNRNFDGEQKQIEYLYDMFKNNKQVKGKIEIVSDLKICPNCNYIIDRFKKDFPNIEIVKVWVRNSLK